MQLMSSTNIPMDGNFLNEMAKKKKKKKIAKKWILMSVLKLPMVDLRSLEVDIV